MCVLVREGINENTFLLGGKENNFFLKARDLLFKEGKLRTKYECEKKVGEGLWKRYLKCRHANEIEVNKV